VDLKRTFIDLMPAPFVRFVAAPYVAGKSLPVEVAKVDQLQKEYGLHATVDLLGEEVFKREDVEATVAIYLRIIEAVKDRPYASISLKPTQLGMNESEEYAHANLRRVVGAAAVHGIHITVDMEDHTFTDATLRIFKKLRDEFDNVGIVLQSRLFRTAEDIRALHTKPCKVRICIGIYREPADIALQEKPDMKDKLFEHVGLLLDLGHYPEIATHDEPLVRRCLAYLEQRGVPTGKFEFQMLLGVPRTALQQELVKKGHVVRLYVPFAEEWQYAIHYLKRRLAANPMMAMYVLKNLFSR
jgi:proline dehydrogenase